MISPMQLRPWPVPADRTFTPDPAAVGVYNKLYQLYRRLHDSFGTCNIASRWAT